MLSLFLNFSKVIYSIFFLLQSVAVHFVAFACSVYVGCVCDDARRLMNFLYGKGVDFLCMMFEGGVCSSRSLRANQRAMR